MMNYRRNRLPGGTYFFTVVTANRTPLFNNPAAVQRLRTTLRNVINRHPFTIDAMVVLPDHIHCLWTLPADDTNYSTRWRLVKGGFTKHFPQHSTGKPGKPKSLWQKRYWEHTIRDENDFNRHVDYIHYNPVKHGYVARAVDWPYSSFHRFVREGVLPVDWGIDEAELEGVGRE
ncbi:transposase [Marinobacter panjinensis]|uniref:Transposase n=1 Tax=Marinobacter panjinensis TaxID=2576384 RepID=A0A4U6R5N7_9GAMM|nr:transposase [Marinobacter panjinensis]MCR8913749.1 transposase [Marinobacter panjinensis]TKV67606.1 transposase [Marinobacter panjinensis]